MRPGTACTSVNVAGDMNTGEGGNSHGEEVMDLAADKSGADYEMEQDGSESDEVHMRLQDTDSDSGDMDDKKFKILSPMAFQNRIQ